MEPPEDWNLTRIGSHRLYEWPNEHEKDNIENCEHDYDSRVVCVKEKLELLIRLTSCFWQPNYKHVDVVDKANDRSDQDNEYVANDHSRSYW